MTLPGLSKSNKRSSDFATPSSNAPTLVHFDPDANHELRTDASAFDMGAVLYQKHDEPTRTGVVLYFSKTLNAAMRNYSATER